MIFLFILSRTYISEVELGLKKKGLVVCVWDNVSYGEVNLLNLQLWSIYEHSLFKKKSVPC